MWSDVSTVPAVVFNLPVVFLWLGRKAAVAAVAF